MKTQPLICIPPDFVPNFSIRETGVAKKKSRSLSEFAPLIEIPRSAQHIERGPGKQDSFNIASMIPRTPPNELEIDLIHQQAANIPQPQASMIKYDITDEMIQRY